MTNDIKIIDGKQAMELMERAVDEYGADHKVPGCRYFTEDGTPECIVGVALSYLGVTVEDLDKIAEDGVPQSSPNLAEVFKLVIRNVTLTPEAVRHFLKAQRVQDRSEFTADGSVEPCNWGNALAVAKGL